MLSVDSDVAGLDAADWHMVLQASVGARQYVPELVEKLCLRPT
jgi:hypothetical protein